jgi:hypothetical protein
MFSLRLNEPEFYSNLYPRQPFVKKNFCIAKTFFYYNLDVFMIS